MKLSELTIDLERIEREVAYGSQTFLWSQFCEDCFKRYGVLPHHDEAAETEVDQDFIEHWWDLYDELGTPSPTE